MQATAVTRRTLLRHCCPQTPWTHPRTPAPIHFRIHSRTQMFSPASACIHATPQYHRCESHCMHGRGARHEHTCVHYHPDITGQGCFRGPPIAHPTPETPPPHPPQCRAAPELRGTPTPHMRSTPKPPPMLQRLSPCHKQDVRATGAARTRNAANPTEPQSRDVEEGRESGAARCSGQVASKQRAACAGKICPVIDVYSMSWAGVCIKHRNVRTVEDCV